MNKLAKWVGILDVILIVAYIIFKSQLNLSSEMNSFVIGLLVGITFFVLFLIITTFIKNLLTPKKQKSKKAKPESNKFIYALGIVLSIIVVVLTFSFSLYIQALLGGDLFLSLDLENESFSVANGENISIKSDFGIITNPFCFATCNLSLKDLSSGEVLSSENTLIFLSSPVSRDYKILVDEDYSGQKLYRIDMRCSTEGRVFCYTSTNKSKYTSKIISVEHSLSAKQNQTLNKFKDKIFSLNKNLSQLILDLENLNATIINSSSLNLSEYNNPINNLSSESNANNLNEIINLYNQQKWNLLEESLQEKDSTLGELKNRFSSLADSVNSEFNSYNMLINNLNSMNSSFSSFYSVDLDNSSLASLNHFVDEFNLGIINFSQSSNLLQKEIIVKNLNNSMNNLTLSNSLNESLRLERQLNNFNFSYLTLNLTESNFSLNLSEPSSVCCLSDNCESCLNESSSSVNYPVILLHGHGFNEKVSALGSLEIFNSLQENLEKDGYINAGSLFYLKYNNEYRRTLGKVNAPVSIKASYYFDVLSTEESYSLLETKEDNIDTYAIRLKDIVDNVKYITGKDKVIIVAHSMGGLVARRYVQVFGEDSVDKIVLIATPNHGVEGFVVNYCSLFGTEDECDDMSTGSLFLNKLNRGENPSVPVYNIIGEGCTWENVVGDGIVTNNSAYLSFAKNYYINGTCDGFEYFHNTMLEVDKYPETYSLVKEILAN